MAGQLQEKIETFSISNVTPGMRVSQDIKDKNGFLLVGANTELTDRLIDKLKQFGIIRVPIFVAQQSSNIPINNINLNEIFREQLLDSVNTSIVNFIKNDTFVDRIVQIITDITKDDILMSLLIEIKTIGHNVLMHSINVFTLSMLIGLKNHFPMDRLMVLGQASLLHDIGKKFLPSEILDNARNLSEDNKKVFEQHALFGFEYLQSLGKLPYEISRIVLQHHERLDGSGYPNKLSKDDIHKLAQIIAITDAFDSIIDSQERTTRFAFAEAIEFLLGSGGIYFNYDLSTCLLEEITVFHLYDWVVLSNDDIGIITKVHDSTPLRPVVTVFFDKFKQKYSFPKQIDLTAKLYINLFIKSSLD